jgi:hypothetical protein
MLLEKEDLNCSIRNWNYLVFALSPQTESLFLCGDGNTFLNLHHIEFRSKDVKFKDFIRMSYMESF